MSFYLVTQTADWVNKSRLTNRWREILIMFDDVMMANCFVTGLRNQMTTHMCFQRNDLDTVYQMTMITIASISLLQLWNYLGKKGIYRHLPFLYLGVNDLEYGVNWCI